MSGGTDDASDPVEAYLDRALVSLPGTPREVRHALAEIEEHLRDAASAARARGLDEQEARAAAVAAFGPVGRVVDRPRNGLRLTPALRRRLTLAALLMGAVAGLALGAAGVVAAAVRAAWGPGSIAAPFPPGAYSQADCARWQAGYPEVRGCVAAMTADHADDFLRNTGGCAVLGLLALLAYARLRRRWAVPSVSRALPPAAEETVGALLALAAAAVLSGQGIDALLVTHGQGSGQDFALAASALLAAGYLARRATRHHRGAAT